MMTESAIGGKAIPNQSQIHGQPRKQIRQRQMMKRRRKIRRTRFFIFIVCILTITTVLKVFKNEFAQITDTVAKKLVNTFAAVAPTVSDKLDMAGLMPQTINSNEDWALRLINKDNPLPDGYKPELSSLQNGLEFDSRAVTQLNVMLAAAEGQGLSPVVCSAYRSVERQKELFDSQVKAEMAKGLSREQAEAEACKAVAYPGTSEHSSALAADIVSMNYQILDKAQEDTPETKWLIAHCAEYGFILRYPQDKSELTGIMYEPWHYRYVGIEAAKVIMESGICLEEYIDYIFS